MAEDELIRDAARAREAHGVHRGLVAVPHVSSSKALTSTDDDALQERRGAIRARAAMASKRTVVSVRKASSAANTSRAPGRPALALDW